MKAEFRELSEKERLSGPGILQNRKENNFLRQYSVISSDLESICELRIYATQARHYACFWLHGDDYRSGGGWAGGYGYHRASAAACEALEKAGITLDESISGRGDSAIEEALLAIGKKVTRKKIKIFRAHA